MTGKPLAKTLITSLVMTMLVTLAPVQAATPPLTNSQAIARWGGIGFPASGLWLLEDFNLGFDPSALYKTKQTANKTELTLCSGINDPNCSETESLYQILNFDVCTPNSLLACIAGIWAIDQSGKRIEGELVRSIPIEERQFVQENVDLNLPKSTSYGSIFRIPGVKNEAGNENYFAATRVTLFKQPSQKKFELGEIASGIVPINELRGDYGVRSIIPTGGHGSTGPTRSPAGEECVALEQGICRERVDFPSEYKFGMTIRVGEKLSGWYHGRLSLPDISIKEWKSGQEISIEGHPVKVPSLDFVVPYSELSESAKKVFDDCAKTQCGGRGNTSGIHQLVGNLNHPSTLEWIKAYNKDYQDRSTKTQTFWSFKKMFNHAGVVREDELKRCGDKAGSLTGLVLTNSLVYSSGPPAFESSTGSLVYTVASPHFESNGRVASGTYDLTLRSDVARCIYGFSNAPIKADISITGDDGENRVATTVVREEDGWLYLSAKGFTFSAPKIQVKLTQEQVAKVEEVKAAPPTSSEVPTTTAVAAPPKAATIKKSITCVKGKAIKKVSGTSPKCPAGFKKK
jgi:hypothetical protein